MNQTSIGKLMWGVGAKYKKIYSRKGKLNEKNSWTPINPKKIFMLWPKKFHARNLITKKKFLWLENSPPPITFLIVRLLSYLFWGGGLGTGDGGRGTGRWAVRGDGGSLYF